MAQGIPILKDAPYNVLTVPNYVRDLVVTTAPGTIKAQYNPPDDPEATECWTTYKAGSYPEHPFDGKRVVTPLETPEIDAHTLFLWHADDMTDSSSAPKEITNHGAEIAEDAGAYGGKAGRFGGAQRLTAAASFTLDDFTVDFRIKHNGNAEWAGILCTAPTTLDNFTYFDGALNISFAAGNKLIIVITHGTPGVYDEAITSLTVPTGRWVHVAVVRSAGVVKVYIDGKASATLACATQVRADGTIQIGRHDIRDGMYLSADIDEFRISDTVRWTADFEPPLAAYGSREPVAVSMTDGVVNDTQYGIRVFTRGRLGFQTRKGGAQAMARPVAGLPLLTFQTNNLLQIQLDGATRLWRILHHGNPDPAVYDVSFNTGTMLMLEDIYALWPFGGTAGNYRDSDVRNRLNSEFVPNIDQKMQSHLIEVKVPCLVKVNYGAYTYLNGSNGLPAKAYLIATSEIFPSSSSRGDGCLLNCFSGGVAERIAYYNGTATAWLTRNYAVPSGCTAITAGGDTTGGYETTPYGVRPIIVVQSDLLVNPTPNPDGSYSPIL